MGKAQFSKDEIVVLTGNSAQEYNGGLGDVDAVIQRRHLEPDGTWTYDVKIQGDNFLTLGSVSGVPETDLK
jgi:hypothetical protein